MGVLVGWSEADFTAAAVTGSGRIIDSCNMGDAVKGKKERVTI